jgi:osmotically-inducible protein OsmY
MIRKLLLIILALFAVALALFSYGKYYARKDVPRMLNEVQVKASVRTALALNRHLNNTEIEVSVSDGEVTLSGVVGTEIQKQLAENIALSIKGVNKVQNTLKVSRLLARGPTERVRTLGERLDDLTIEAAIKTSFMLNENVKARDIRVSSQRGRITLTGTFASPAEVELARKIAEDVEGVILVETEVTIEEAESEAGDESLMQKVDDARIVAQVRAALMVNRTVESPAIEVSSREGVVTLTGIVRSGAEKDLAHKIAEDCRGVRGVVTELRIK